MTAPERSAQSVTSERPVGVDLFCGAGGMSLGFEQAGFDVLAGVDCDPLHLAVHERNLPHAFPVCADIALVSADDIESAVRKGWSLAGRPGEWDGNIDCLFGGPNCQGFSGMGKRNSDDHRNELVFSFARLVEELRPNSFVMENVPGLLASNVRHTLDVLLRTLRSAGYKLQRDVPVCLDASDYGVPQRRRRLFIVGVQDGAEPPAVPTVRDSPSVSEALDDLPNVDDIDDLLDVDCVQLTAHQTKAMDAAASPYARSLRRRQALEYERRWDPTILTGSQRTRHSEDVRGRFAGLLPGAEDPTSRTSRLHGGEFAKTLRAGTGLDHGSFTAPRPIHHQHPRVITVREAARLHSFPDWFRFHVTKWHGLREIGNSVPPRLAAVVARSVAESLGFAPSPPQREIDLGGPELLAFTLREAAERYGYDETALPRDVRRGSPTA